MKRLVVLAVGVVLFVGCDKKTDSSGTVAASAPAASPDAKTTAATIRRLYPVDCDVNAASWNWGTCYDATTGFDPLLVCAAAARDQAKAGAARLPPATAPNPDVPCAATVEGQSRVFVTNTATFLDDVVTWLTAHKAALVGPLRRSSLHDIDNDKLKADMPHDYDKKYGGDAAMGESLRFGWVNDITCTKALYRCGSEEDPSHNLTYIDCGMRAAAARLGVECGTSSPYHHADGKPYCLSFICDLNNPRTWLYDAMTKARIP